jgi:hypothetical protein
MGLYMVGTREPCGQSCIPRRNPSNGQSGAGMKIGGYSSVTIDYKSRSGNDTGGSITIR